MASETIAGIADVVAEMRELAADIEAGNAVVGQTVWRNYADRIEAAAKRDAAIHAMTCEANERLREHLEIALEDNKRTVGNAAAMREALVQIVALATQDQPRFAIISAAETALAKPPRNCDVGTAKEQEERFRKYCWNHSSKDKNMECRCPIDTEGKAGCKLEWAQMPYEEGGAK